MMPTPLPKPASKRSVKGYPGSRGFSLIEVMVSVLIMSLGLLGFAKMQAAAIANTKLSASRSLLALQTGSMAAAMQSNRGYWASGVTPTAFSAAGIAVTDASGVLNATGIDCTSAATPCSPFQLAAYDLQAWANNMNQQFPSYAATFACTNVVGAELNCTIKVTWSERYVAINKTTAADASAQTATQSYTLYVAP